MKTECNTELFDCQPHKKQDVRGILGGGAITPDAEALLLRKVIARLSITHRILDTLQGRKVVQGRMAASSVVDV